jgi:hypothetical protein
MATPLEFKHIVFENTTILVPILDTFKKTNNTFLEEVQFVAFFDKLLHSLSAKQGPLSVCLNNNFYERQKQKMNAPTVLENFLHIDIPSYTAKMSMESIEYINTSCQHKSLIVIPIKLGLLNVLDDYGSTFDLNEMNDYVLNGINIFNDFDKTHHSVYHSNVLIIDNKNRRIEYFEPHGVTFGHLTAQLVNLQSIILKIVQDLFPFTKNYEFRNAANTCLYGVQNLQQTVDQAAGHCLAWSLFFLIIRLVNNNIKIKSKETVSEFLNRFLTTMFSAKQLDSLIKKFMTYVEQLPATTKYYSKHAQIDMTNYIDIIDKINMEDRCTILANLYFQKLATFSFKNIDKLFEELTSYRRLPSFQTIMNQAFDKVIKNQSSKKLDLNLISPFFTQ